MIQEIIATSDFHQFVLKSELPVLADFWAPWCKPCMLMGRILDKLDSQYQDKLKCVKINVDVNAYLANKYDVVSIPTILLFRNGKLVKRFVGVTHLLEIEKALLRELSRPISLLEGQ